MSTGRRKSESNGTPKSPSRARKPSNDGNQLLLGLMIGGGVVAVAGIVFFLTLGTSSPPAPPAPPPVAVATPPAMAAAPPAGTPTIPTTNPTLPGLPAGSGVPAAVANPAGNPLPVQTVATTAPMPMAAVPGVPSAVPNAGGPMAMLISKDAAPKPAKEYSLPELIEFVDPGVVRLTCKKPGGSGMGSGFLIDEEGTVVTNYHVICGAKSVEAEFENGDKAAVEGFYVLDEKRDIAVIRIAKPAGTHTPIRLSDDLPKKGTAVVAFGCPHGLSFSTTQGIVSGIRKPDFAKDRLGTTGTMIQTDTPISPGNSGGPLVNMLGEVVAMNTMVMTIGQNLNFSVSAVDIADVLTKKGSTVKPITPESVPDKDRFAEFVARFDDLSATDRGRYLLGQISEVSLMLWEFPLDPSDRINAFCMNHLSKAVQDKLKLKIKSRRERGPSTFSPLVLCMFNWTLPKDYIRGGDLASNLELHISVIARDVDKEGNEVVAIVYKDTAVVGTLSLGALAEGKITKAMETNVPKFFDKFVGVYRKAKRDAQAGTSSK